MCYTKCLTVLFYCMLGLVTLIQLYVSTSRNAALWAIFLLVPAESFFRPSTLVIIFELSYDRFAVTPQL